MVCLTCTLQIGSAFSFIGYSLLVVMIGVALSQIQAAADKGPMETRRNQYDGLHYSTARDQ